MTVAFAVLVGLVSPVGPEVAASAQELAPGGTYTDDDGSTHEGAIEAIAAAGITAGCGGTRFCPDVSVTRAQMASFLARALELEPTTDTPFTDVSGTHAANIGAIAQAGISTGCEQPNAFCPDDAVTRAQMASFLARALELEPTTDTPFTDVSGTHAANIGAIAQAGITLGCDGTGTRYCPTTPVTRAQMATFLTRGLGLTPIEPPPRGLPVAGNPDGGASVPVDGQAADVSDPDHVIGDGTPASCTSDAVVAAVAAGGIIVFDCGPEEVTISMTETAKVVNNTGPEIVIDGGGLVTLDGGGVHRILYMNTCDPDQVWTTSHCNDQDHPRLTVQNLTFTGGHAQGEDLGGGGGAIYVRGGRFKVNNSRFFSNTCDATGPDVGGAAIRVFDQHQDLPVYVVASTFGGAPELGNICSNGGGLSSIGVSYTVLNSLFTHNQAIGNGANPARSGTPGGGSGGAIYNDGNTFTLTVAGTIIEDNHANEGGGAIFFVSNDRSGHLVIEDSQLRRNPSEGFETAGYPGIFYLGDGPPRVSGSLIED